MHEALAAAEFVVLQEAFADTETAPYADLLLPAATWSEREGTMTNSERCMSHLHAAVAPPGEAQPDFQTVIAFARRLGKKLGRDGEKLFPYACAEEVFNEHRESTRGRDLDITGVSYAMLDVSPQQWPLPQDAIDGKARLYVDGIFPTASGRAQFHDAPYRPVAEPIDARYPLHLNTGRLRDQWHGMSRTGKVARLFGHAPEPRLNMNPNDLSRRGLKDGELVKIESRRGSIYSLVEASDTVRSGQVYLPDRKSVV